VSERTAVYRLFDARSGLLYIGIAKNFGRRWQQHSAAKPWWPQVQRQTVDWYPDREMADEAETLAIADEKPLYNIAKVPWVSCQIPAFLLDPILAALADVSPAARGRRVGRVAAALYEEARTRSGRRGWQAELVKETGLTRETIRRHIEDEKIRRGDIAPTPRYLAAQRRAARES
jgi:predicted GIY-YIG superfamily endonuclease